MRRIPEPELMLDQEQARAYAAADFESAHSLYPKLFDALFPDRPRRALVLDIGCGPCDVTRRFARANPGYRFHAVDGSAAMLDEARQTLRRRKLATRVKLIEGLVPDVALPATTYDVILSSSLLHHLRHPQVLWQTVRRYSQPGTLVFVVDLRRPPTREAARALVTKYSGGEPNVLKRDFLNSLLAAFTPAEVRQQLREARLDWLRVRALTDRHLMVGGQRPA
ncbi:MAG TPA: class I SAM-dependent methyltransferase [Verrucomicrobiae bacterium]|nr:class I SAM-dependent methyltransferase [Verrucomicrobiae bacterium]